LISSLRKSEPRVVSTGRDKVGESPVWDPAAQALETVRQTTEILQGRIPVGALNADAATRMHHLAIKPATP